MTTHGGLPTKANSRVLIIGASGGVGHLAVQIAKRAMGAAFVVGVCSSRNEEFVRECGANDVVAYDRTSIESIASEHPDWQGSFDLIFDAVGLDNAWTVLAPQLLSESGRFVAAATPQLADGLAGEDVGVVGGLATLVRFTLRRMGGRYRFLTGCWMMFSPIGPFRRWCNGSPNTRSLQSWQRRTRSTSLQTPIVQARQAERSERFPS
jgi:NADPH:quinone reductase-like Zn-dependent oxidoreductase